MAACFVAPSAAYLWSLPLLAAGVAASQSCRPEASGPFAPRRSWCSRLAATFWLRDTVDLLRIPRRHARAVCRSSRRCSCIAAADARQALMLAPPFSATFAATRRCCGRRCSPRWRSSVWRSARRPRTARPPTRSTQPLRRVVRVLQTPDAPADLGSRLDRARTRSRRRARPPAGFRSPTRRAPGGVPWGRLPHPFVFRTTGRPLGRRRRASPRHRCKPVDGGVELSDLRRPARAGADRLVRPAGRRRPGAAQPARAWSASGTWTATLRRGSARGHPVPRRVRRPRMRPASAQPLVLVTSSRLPGGDGWQSCRPGCRRSTRSGQPTATWALRRRLIIAPVPPLR